MEKEEIINLLQDVDGALWNAENLCRKFLANLDDAEYFAEIRVRVNSILEMEDLP